MKQKKHIVVLSLLASIVLVVGGICAWVGIRSMRANDILKEVQWYDPEGKEFTINTKDELLDVSALSKYYDFKGQKLYLGSDIKLNDGDASKWAEQVPAQVWSPITKFAGVFDGKGHTISGIYAYGVNSSVGLFTETQATCIIKNLRLENSYILGLNDGGTGSIIGCGSGTLDTVYSNTIVEGQADNVGGLIGYIKAGRTNLVQNCWFDGEVKATEGTSSYVGGLVGKVLSNTSLCKIMDCLNTANVNATGEYVGGFIGAIVGETNMWLTDCLSTGDVKGAEGAKTVAMAVGAVFKQVSLTTKTCWVQEGSYAGRFGNAAGEIKGILASAPKEQLQGFDAYTYTTLEFERAWAVQENDIPMLKCFAKNDPDLSGVVKLLDVSWYDEKSAELHIKNLAQLNGFNFLSQVYNYSGQKVVLDNDITINEGKAKDWAKNAPEYEWTPVGRYVDEEGKTKGQTFAGTFDGNGHTISGMYINIDSTKAFAVGFFGKVIGKIQNLSIVNSYIGGTAGGNVGTFAASFAGGIAENLYSNAIIDIDANHVGGIVGRDESEATFINCWFDGAVKGKERVGGIMGSMNNNTTLTIQHCLNSGSVHSTSYYAGGLSGLFSNGVAIVEDSLNVGKITTDKAERWCGGIAGVVNGKEGIGIKATIKNTYSLITANKLAYGLNGPERKIIGAGGILLTESELNGNNAYQFTNLNFKEYWSVVKGKSPVLKTFATGTMKASGSKLADMNWYTVAGKSFKISTAAQLRGLAILSRTNTFEGQTIELTKDIKLPENFSWEPIGKHVDGAKNTVGQIFKGTFKGNGHTIAGLNIELGENAVAYGLFGQVAGTIQDLRLKDGKITGKAVSAIGSLAGSLVGQATISNIYSNVTVDVDANYVGGIVGKNEGKTKNVITNCWNDGTVVGEERVAGILGYSAQKSEIEITHCLNTKEIKSASKHYVAGMCGLADQCEITITDSLNVGTITLKSDDRLGYSGAILGAVNGKKDTPGTAKVQDVYYLKDSCSNGMNVIAANAKFVTVSGSGVVGLTDKYLTDQNAYVWTTLNFKDYWTVVKKDTPVLKSMATKVETVTTSRFVDISWYDLKGKSFNIDSAEKLAGLALLSRENDFEGQTFNLVKNIKLSDKTNWEPIGKHVDANKDTVGHVFKGTFNGNGKTISGLTMNLEGNEVAYGLFGQVTGTLIGFTVKDSRITGKAVSAIGTVTGDLLGGATISNVSCEDVVVDIKANYVGGIVGKNSGEEKNVIQDCQFKGSISGTSAVGGVLGQAISKSQVDIINCVNDANVSTTGANVGGICGYALEESTVYIEKCKNDGEIKADANYAGGICGYAQKKSSVTINECWNSGKVVANERVGGILGFVYEEAVVELSHCLNTGIVTSTSKSYTAGMVGLSDKGSLTIEDSLNVGVIKPGEEISYCGAIVGGINASQSLPITATIKNVYYLASSSSKGANVINNAKDYVTVEGSGALNVADEHLVGNEALNWTTLDYQSYWTTVKDSTPSLAIFTDGAEKSVTRANINWFDENETNFTISNKAELWGLSLLSETYDFADMTITLKNDITLDKTISWEPIGYHENSTKIGKTFAGTFDGAGHTIHGLFIDMASTTNNMREYGLFGRVSGTIQNLKVDNCTVSGVGHANNQKVGTIIGTLNDGKLLNVQSNATMNAKAHHLGGLVGYVTGSGKSNLIENCKFAGEIIIQGSMSNTGGLVGCVDTTSVEIKKSLNSANITASGSNIGGLCGQVTKGTATISDSLTSGTVALSGTRHATVVGAVNGNSSAKGNVDLNNVYYLNHGTQPICTSQNATNATITNADKCYGLDSLPGDFDWYDVTQTGTTYTLNSKEDLWGLALVSRISDFANKKVNLGANITMDNNSWNPIGYHENPNKIGKTFAGTFDGAGYTITGLNINLASTTENIREYGLFGRVSGTIQNLKLNNCTITGEGHANNQKVGTVVGALYGGKLLNVQSNATINTKAHHLGGLVGCVAGNGTTSLMEHCGFSGTITIQGSMTNAGGLVGIVDTTSLQIMNCLNSANITASGNNIGGLCGQVTKGTASISDSVTTGIVATSGTRHATLVGAVNGNSTSKGNVDLDNVYYMNNGEQPICTSQNTTNATITNATKCYPRTENELKGLGTNTVTLDSEHWVVTEGSFPSLKTITVTQ